MELQDQPEDQEPGHDGMPPAKAQQYAADLSAYQEEAESVPDTVEDVPSDTQPPAPEEVAEVSEQSEDDEDDATVPQPESEDVV